MTIVPVSFSSDNRSALTSHSKRILEDQNNKLIINPKLKSLIVSLKSAQFEDSGKILKEESPFNDTLDCYQEICTFFNYKTKQEDSKVHSKC
jgi:hypothetical protein